MKKLNSFYSIIIIAVFLLISFRTSAQIPVYFDPATLEETLAPGDSVVVNTVLKNLTDNSVEFSFPGYTGKDQGGPDAFGYTWIDSEEPGGPDWSWTDISEVGIEVEGLGDDQMAGPFEMDFSFSYYGQVKNQFWISPNGVISFNNQFIPYANSSIPTNNNYIDFIAWFWDDLKMDSAISKVYFKNFEEKTVVQFTRMVHYPGTESFITGQVIMMINGTIFLKYRIVSQDFETTGATVGIQSWNSQKGLQVVYNAEYVHSELAVRFDPHRRFITSVNPSSLTLPPNSQETIWITYNSEGFEPGSYEQDLKCVTSLAEFPYLLHHNVMHVEVPYDAGFKGYVTDAATGFAINEVLVRVGDHQTYTNDNGYYELPLPQGSYNVKFQRNGYQTLIVEDTTALPGFSILDVELSGYYFIAGQVFAGDNTLETGFAYGYKMIEEEVVDIYAEMVGELGWYEFSGLAAAGYIIKAEPSPNSEYYGAYLPTYYGDVLHWEDASMIELPQSTDDAHINLIAAVNAPTGPGSIGGTISSDSRTAEIPVILRTQDPGVVVMTVTGTDGRYTFENLALGSYEVFAEIPGKSTVPSLVVLSESSPSVDNIDMLVTATEIIFMGIAESEVFQSDPVVIPNPAQDRIHLYLHLKKPSVVTVELNDQYGKKLYASTYHLNGNQRISLVSDQLPAGIYLARIISGNESRVLRVIRR